ncbi:hypothetical protein COC69_32315 [Bacillus cereus]|uniref:Uncharacterized protein n=1 Tax=Bacillus cereus TaxID=1396 RepID=A0A9X7CGM1_BACCE|nr:hypothetical protein COC69_32315 [Bacillus cereus]
MSNHTKAKKLYKVCDTNPEISTLISWKTFHNTDFDYLALLVGFLINHYAINTYNSDFIPCPST